MTTRHVNLSCPKCGCMSFNETYAPEISEQHDGATCLGCGTFLTSLEILDRMGVLVEENVHASSWGV
jgi:hypothetical protein